MRSLCLQPPCPLLAPRPVHVRRARPAALQAPILRLLALAPLNLLALWATDMDEVKVSAGVGLAAATAQLLSAQQSQRVGAALI